MSEITYISEELVMEGNLDSAGSSVVVAGRFKGELRAKAPQLMLGYLDETLDSEAFDENGYFRTGDLGIIDTD